MNSFSSQKAATAILIQTALQLHRSGKLQEAETIYRQVLASSPANFDALHLLGVLSHQIGNNVLAVNLIGKATKIDKKNPNAFSHLGAAYRSLGRYAEAEKCYRTALRLQPDFPEVYFNLGNTLADLKRLKEAEKAYFKAVQLNPDYAAAYNNLGTTLNELKRIDEAEGAFRKALVLKPDFAEAYNNLGNALNDLGRPHEAELAYRQAIELVPDYDEVCRNMASVLLDLNRPDEAELAFKKALAIRPDSATYFNLGNTLVKLKKFDEAVQLFRRVTELQPDYAEAFLNLGNAMHELGRYKEAEQAYVQVMALKPDLADTYNSFANTLSELDRLDEAEIMYTKALMLKPDYADAHYNLGHALNDLGRLEDAEKAYRQALAYNPDDAMTQWNLGLLKLMQGDLDEGLRLHERRFDRGKHELEATIKILNQLQGYKRWHGEPLEGMSLIVIAEQGAGDNLMMMRYLPLLKKQKLRRLTVYCYPQLFRVMLCMPGVDEIVPITEPLPFGCFDLYCPIMSLPHLLNTRLESIPAHVPYLVFPQEMRQKWRTRLAGVEGLKVGLVWAGNQSACFDSIRSIHLSRFAPLLDLAGAHFYSLQKTDESDQLKELGWNIVDWMDECEDYLDTAALVDQLDLIIGVDTSVAHLAGALGKPVWLLNRFESEWRWMLHRVDSPWYPSMKIFRQNERSDWDSVISQICEELAGLCQKEHNHKFGITRCSNFRKEE
jgi:tetratricopeptide (TPR) repeat protein